MDIQKIVKSLQDIGLTQREIAKAVDCSQPTISDIAAGQIGKVRPSHKVVSGLLGLAKVHDISDDGQPLLVSAAPKPQMPA